MSRVLSPACYVQVSKNLGKISQAREGSSIQAGIRAKAPRHEPVQQVQKHEKQLGVSRPVKRRKRTGGAGEASGGYGA